MQRIERDQLARQRRILMTLGEQAQRGFCRFVVIDVKTVESEMEGIRGKGFIAADQAQILGNPAAGLHQLIGYAHCHQVVGNEVDRSPFSGQ